MAGGKQERGFHEMPGPWGLPILGSTLTLGTAHPRKFMEWGSKYYGDVFRYKILYQDYVVLNSFESVKEALLANGTQSNGRVPSLVTDRLFQGKGLFFTDYGEAFDKWKKFVMEAITEVMQGMAGKICDQAQKLLHDMSRNGFGNGEVLDIKNSLKCRLAQVAILTFVNKEYEDGDLQNIVDNVYNPLRATTMFGILYLLPRLASFTPFTGYLKTHEAVYGTLRKRFADSIRLKISSATKSEDIASCYINQYSDPNDEEIEQLTGLYIDCIFAGTATCAEEILWIVLFLLKNPEMLRRVRKELHQALKKHGKIEQVYHNKESVPLLQAAIHETMRLRPIAPKAFFHKTLKDVVIGGFRIPKDVVLLPNIWSVHHDPVQWAPDPEAFRPERHLNEDGKFIPSEYIIPFSVGGRRCAGERLARANIFIFTASLLSRYDLELAPESVDVNMDGELKSLLETSAFKISQKKS